MTWLARIEPRFEFGRTAVYLMQEQGNGFRGLLGPGGGTIAQYRPDESAASDERPDPALWLPEGSEHALLGALSRHLGSVDHPEQLRRDYEAERARVDRFIAHLTEVPRA